MRSSPTHTQLLSLTHARVFSSVVQAVLDCKGTVFFSGVGKSGFISQKISMTLVSTGTKSVFLNPTDALHGDIGIVGQDDLLVLFSKSGATEELIKLIPYAKVRAPPAGAFFSTLLQHTHTHTHTARAHFYKRYSTPQQASEFVQGVEK